MTEIPIYQVDAFTHRPFAGNPAAVCPLERSGELVVKRSAPGLWKDSDANNYVPVK